MCFQLKRSIYIWPIKSKFDVKFLPSEKVIQIIFWTFSMLVWSCSEVVWASFWALKATLSGVCLAQKVDIWPLKSKFDVKFWPSEKVILIIFRVKQAVFWGFWKLVWSCSEVVWASFLAVKAQFSGVFLARKVNIWPLKSKMYHFDHLQGQKTCFLDFLKVGLE